MQYTCEYTQAQQSEKYNHLCVGSTLLMLIAMIYYKAIDHELKMLKIEAERYDL